MSLERKILRNLAGLAGVIWCAAGAAQPAFSDAPPEWVIEDRLQLDVSASWLSFSTEARVDASVDEPGTVFKAERDFGIRETKLLPLTELTLLPGKRHLLRLSSLRVTRSGRATLTRDIEYDGEIYEQGKLVTSSLRLNMTGLTYGYQFLRRKNFDLAATIGIQIADFETNAEIPGEILRQPTGAVSPLPMLGLEGRANLTARWAVEGRVQYSRVSLDLIEGTVMDARLAALWRVSPHFALGLAYRTFSLEAESFDDDSAGLIDLRMTGPMLFARGSL